MSKRVAEEVLEPGFPISFERFLLAREEARLVAREKALAQRVSERVELAMTGVPGNTSVRTRSLLEGSAKLGFRLDVNNTKIAGLYHAMGQELTMELSTPFSKLNETYNAFYAAVIANLGCWASICEFGQASMPACVSSPTEFRALCKICVDQLAKRTTDLEPLLASVRATTNNLSQVIVELQSAANMARSSAPIADSLKEAAAKVEERKEDVKRALLQLQKAKNSRVFLEQHKEDISRQREYLRHRLESVQRAIKTIQEKIEKSLKPTITSVDTTDKKQGWWVFTWISRVSTETITTVDVSQLRAEKEALIVEEEAIQVQLTGITAELAQCGMTVSTTRYAYEEALKEYKAVQLAFTARISEFVKSQLTAETNSFQESLEPLVSIVPDLETFSFLSNSWAEIFLRHHSDSILSFDGIAAIHRKDSLYFHNEAFQKVEGGVLALESMIFGLVVLHFAMLLMNIAWIAFEAVHTGNTEADYVENSTLEWIALEAAHTGNPKAADPDVENSDDLWIENEYSMEASRQLVEAACSGDAEGVRNALRSQADPNAYNRRGDTVLHMACALGDLTIVNILCCNYADFDYQNIYGDSPLHYASQHPKVVDYLINICEADQTVKNQEGCTYETWDSYSERVTAFQGVENC